MNPVERRSHRDRRFPMPIPVNLITGFLGVGKTTAVIDLLKRKPLGSRWAVLVNEYGEVGIDAALIEGSGPEGVSVQEVAGGCVCCASAPYLPVALHFLLLDAKPERLLIETTGLGHPARLLDMLRRDYADRLDVRATLGLVDPADFANPAMRDNRVFLEQVQLADVLVMNKLDCASPELVAEFQNWANGLYPPKLLIAGTTHGRLQAAWLDLSANDERNSMESPPTAAGGLYSHGWVFGPEVIFDHDRLLAFLRDVPSIVRLKGVFRTPHEWIAVNRTSSGLSVEPTAYRRDSRLEAFGVSNDWDAFERRLTECVVGR